MRISIRAWPRDLDNDIGDSDSIIVADLAPVEGIHNRLSYKTMTDRIPSPVWRYVKMMHHHKIRHEKIEWPEERGYTAEVICVDECVDYG